MRHQLRFVNGHALAKRAKLRAWTNIVSWQIRTRFQHGAIRCKWVGGAVLMVKRGMTGATGNVYVGLHEFADMGFLLHFLRPDDLFVDVGANIGSYTVLAARVCGATVIAFEPDPGTAENLAVNLRANDIGDLVIVRESAVGASIGTIAFSMDMDTINHVVEDAAPREHVRTVPVTTLDMELSSGPPALIKIDVEGHEPAVIAGAEATLAAPSLKAIIIERPDPAVRAILVRHGFRECGYDPFTRSLQPGRPGQRGPNSLYVRDEGFVAARLAGAPPFAVLGQTV